ncbi:MAG: hypothetical protein ACYDA1_00030 [Vulcanimicrobiaceae bacterium]
MPQTVSASITKFRTDSVDLTAETTMVARSSRDFLFEQIKTLAKSSILSGSTLSFGSFSRRTKMQPLDDIDCLAMLRCGNAALIKSGYTYDLKITNLGAALAPYADANGFVNSTLILNAVKKALESVPQYSKSNIGRNGSAVVLDLKSYTWSFDVVPACAVSGPNDSIAYYIIPNGTGKWKATDPRIDAARATEANARHTTLFLPSVRLLKYWNRRTHKPKLPSYYFETLLTNRALQISPYKTIQNALHDLLWGLRETVKNVCPDPKGREPNLDAAVDPDTKQKVYNAATLAWHAAKQAIDAEIVGDHTTANAQWASLFGPSFTSFG